MARRVIIELDEASAQWLDERAASRGTTAEAALAALIADARARSAEPSWQEQDMLQVFATLGARPEQPIPVELLGQNWRSSGDDFVSGLRGLIAKGLVMTNAEETFCALTEAGYARIA